jgi:hypothetical protein
MMMTVAHASETSVFLNDTTWRIAEGCNIHVISDLLSLAYGFQNVMFFGNIRRGTKSKSTILASKISLLSAAIPVSVS